LVVYGMLVYFALLTLRSQRMRVVLVGGAVVLVTLIGFSRAYLGAYYVSDVVGGFAAGGAWLSAVITAREAVRRRDMANQRGPVSSP
jgi:undecaprenyl-diphosphatase